MLCPKGPQNGARLKGRLNLPKKGWGGGEVQDMCGSKHKCEARLADFAALL